MSEISLESVDKVIERTGVSYSEAKEALEASDGDVLEAIIYLENKDNGDEETDEKVTQTIDEFKAWLKDLINKGNVSRIKIRKDDKVIVDVPVNAGIAVGVMAIIMPALLAFGVIAAVATKITIEITKSDGTVEVVNKYVSDAAEEVKDKASSFADTIKDKFNVVKNNVSSSVNMKKDSDDEKTYNTDEVVYSYKVKFDDDSTSTDNNESDDNSDNSADNADKNTDEN